MDLQPNSIRFKRFYMRPLKWRLIYLSNLPKLSKSWKYQLSVHLFSDKARCFRKYFSFFIKDIKEIQFKQNRIVRFVLGHVIKRQSPSPFLNLLGVSTVNKCRSFVVFKVWNSYIHAIQPDQLKVLDNIVQYASNIHRYNTSQIYTQTKYW